MNQDKDKYIDWTAIRKEYGLTQQEFAEALGVASDGAMSMIERSHSCGVKVVKGIYERAGKDFDADLIDCICICAQNAADKKIEN